MGPALKSKKKGVDPLPDLGLSATSTAIHCSGSAQSEDKIMETVTPAIPLASTRSPAYWRPRRKKGGGDGSPSIALTCALLVPAKDRPQRSMPLRVRQEVQKMFGHTPSRGPSPMVTLFAASWADKTAPYH